MKINFDNHKYCYLFLLSISCSLMACQAIKPSNKKVLVVHARGISHSELMEQVKFLESESYLKTQYNLGTVKKFIPVTNAVTVTNLASFETGRDPSEHGIIGHTYAINNNDNLMPTSGFAQKFSHPTFWEQADKQGKNILRIGALNAHGKYTKHANVDTMTQGSQTGNAQLIKLTPKQSSSMVKYTHANSSFDFLLQPKDTIPVKLYRLNNDNKLFIDTDFDHLNGTIAELSANDWTDLKPQSTNSHNEAFSVKWLSQNDMLYIRSPYKNNGYPQAFLEEVNEQLGITSGWPNIALYTSGGIDANTVWEEIETETSYLMQLFSFATNRKKYDLVVVDYPMMDRIGHAFLQQKSTSKVVSDYYQKAFQAMSDDFSQIAEFAQSNAYELIISSGHGFSPVHTSFDLNKFLLNNGINTQVQTKNWEVFGVPGKVSSHVYFNPQLPPLQKQQLIKSIKVLLKNIKDPQSEQAIVEKVYEKNELHQIGLEHNNSGDLFVILKPGFVMANMDSNDSYFGSPVFNGDHGYTLNHDDSYGVIIINNKCNPCTNRDLFQHITQKLKIQ